MWYTYRKKRRFLHFKNVLRYFVKSGSIVSFRFLLTIEICRNIFVKRAADYLSNKQTCKYCH
jgi:hypothetical protein